ncbi:DUF6624 domain-containing protein [Flavobacteriaceae bacterium M23B6Z8]
MQKSRCYFLLFFLLINFHFVLAQHLEELSFKIDSMVKVDQRVQEDYLASFKSANLRIIDSLGQRQKQTFKRNCKVCKDIFDQYSFPGINLVGEVSSFNFWLLVQHCDHDVVFQQNVLKVMKTEICKGNVDKKNYAFLYDRVMVNLGKKQKYGTQLVYNSAGKPKLYPIKNISGIESRRKAMGLDSLEDYLKSHMRFQEHHSDKDDKN